MSNPEISQPGDVMDQIQSAITGTEPERSTGSKDVYADVLMEAMGIPQKQEDDPDGQETDSSGSGAGTSGSGQDSRQEGLQPGPDQAASDAAGEPGSEPGEAGSESVRDQKLTDLAKELGTNAQKLYSISVDMGKDEPKTIGELKDAYRNQQDFEVEFATREKALIEQSSQLREAQQTLMMLQDDIKDHVDPEKLGALRDQQQAALAREGERLRQVAPELSDEAAFGKFREGLVDFMGSYGFKPQELNISDHRILLVLRDAMELRTRLDRLSNTKPEVKKFKAAKPKTVDTGKRPQREQIGRHPSDDIDKMANILMKG